jgi:nicotinamide mononucleotide (NMN) deamidase PncC
VVKAQNQTCPTDHQISVTGYSAERGGDPASGLGSARLGSASAGNLINLLLFP